MHSTLTPAQQKADKALRAIGYFLIGAVIVVTTIIIAISYVAWRLYHYADQCGAL